MQEPSVASNSLLSAGMSSQRIFWWMNSINTLSCVVRIHHVRVCRCILKLGGMVCLRRAIARMLCQRHPDPIGGPATTTVGHPTCGMNWFEDYPLHSTVVCYIISFVRFWGGETSCLCCCCKRWGLPGNGAGWFRLVSDRVDWCRIVRCSVEGCPTVPVVLDDVRMVSGRGNRIGWCQMVWHVVSDGIRHWHMVSDDFQLCQTGSGRI